MLFKIYKKSLCGCLYYGHVGVCVRACRSRCERCYLCLSVVEEDRLNNLKAYSELKKQSAQFCQSAFLFSWYSSMRKHWYMLETSMSHLLSLQYQFWMAWVLFLTNTTHITKTHDLSWIMETHPGIWTEGRKSKIIKISKTISDRKLVYETD